MTGSGQVARQMVNVLGHASDVRIIVFRNQDDFHKRDTHTTKELPLGVVSADSNKVDCAATMKSVDRRSVLRVLPGAVSVLLLGALFWSMELKGLRQGIALLAWPSLMLLVMAALLASVMQGVRFWVLYPGGLSLTKHLGLVFAVQAGNILLPVRSGELIRPVYMKRWNPQISLRALVGWSVVDKVVELVALLPVVMVACALLPAQLASLARWAWLLGGLVVVVLCGLLLITMRRSQLRSELRLHRVLWALGLSLLYWLMNYLIFVSVVPNARLSLLLLLGVSVASGIPGLPAGMGSYEAAFVWIGQIGQLPKEQLLIAALVSHMMQIAVSLSVGVLVLFRWGWPSKDTLYAQSNDTQSHQQTDTQSD